MLIVSKIIGGDEIRGKMIMIRAIGGKPRYKSNESLSTNDKQHLKLLHSTQMMIILINCSF